MSDYAKLKVAELRELLKGRGLPTAGTKPELTARLVEDDTKKEVVVLDAHEEPPAPVVAEEPTPVAAAPAPAPAAVLESTEEEEVTQIADSALEAPAPAAVPEDDEVATKTAEVIDELKKRIERSKRFGGEPDAEAVASLKRVEKFGLQGVYRANKILNNGLSAGNNGGQNGRRNGNRRASHGKRNRPHQNEGRVVKAAGPAESSETLRKRRERFAS